MQAELEILARIAEEAGRAIMAVRAEGFEVMEKDDHSPLTRADLASHETIVKGLTEHFPGLPVLSEEGKDIAYAERARWERLFIVDPLDGTKEFVKELGEFCVCIALAGGGFPTLGAVHAPVWGKTYVGGLGIGAWRRENAGAWEQVRVRRPDPSGYVVLASRSHPSPPTEQWLTRVAIKERVSAGSALKFCQVAEGAADLYPRLGFTREWDTAAGQAVLEGAGGSVLVLDEAGEPTRRMPVNKPDLLNPFFLASARPLP